MRQGRAGHDRNDEDNSLSERERQRSNGIEELQRAHYHVHEFGEDAAHRPDVNRLRVVLLEEDEFGRTVPSCDHMASELILESLGMGYTDYWLAVVARRGREALSGFRLPDSPGEPKVADLHGAVLVNQTVRRLEITVVDTSRMNIFQTDQQIVQQRLDV